MDNICAIQDGVAVPNYLSSAITTPSTSMSCTTDKMESGALWLGLAGLAIIAVLMQRNVKVGRGVTQQQAASVLVLSIQEAACEVTRNPVNTRQSLCIA